ncbi:MAG: sulfite exporter TauE/SafE family protein [Terriglobales bacterium]
MDTVLLLVGLGFVCGVIASTAVSPSLLSFPVLLALGYPPLVANVTNTVGMAMPTTLGGSLGYRARLKNEGGNAAWLALAGGLGGAAGGGLLLLLGRRAFEIVGPWLLVCAAVLVLAGPWVVRGVFRGREPKGRTAPALALTFAFSIYGGYFGAGVGPMLVGAYGLLLRGGVQRANALKVLVVLAGNLAATIFFAFFGPVDWDAVLALAASSIVGGYVGAHTARRMPDWLLRAAVAGSAVVAAVIQLIQR